MNRSRRGFVARQAPLMAALLAGACSAGPVEVVGLDPGSLRLGMVAHWSCDQGGEGPLVDRSGNRHDGTLFGPVWIPGHFAGALHFDWGNWVDVPAFPQAGSSWSVALWYRAPAGDFGNDYLALLGNLQLLGGGWEMNARLGASGRQYHFRFPVGADGGGAAAHVETDQVDVDRFVHLAVVLDGDNRRLALFKNGEQMDETGVPSSIQPGSDSLSIGRWSDNRHFLVGDLDDIVIFNRALVPAEVRALVARPAPELR